MGCLFLINLSLGSVSIPLKVFNSLTGAAKKPGTTIVNYRLPKAIAAILVGMGLHYYLLMQTLFSPGFGPYVLGLSSGASLGVAVILERIFYRI
jgi:iron complex transport system permease protein